MISNNTILGLGRTHSSGIPTYNNPTELCIQLYEFNTDSEPPSRLAGESEPPPPKHLATFLFPKLERPFRTPFDISTSYPVDRQLVYPSLSCEQNFGVKSSAELINVCAYATPCICGCRPLALYVFAMQSKTILNWKIFAEKARAIGDPLDQSTSAKSNDSTPVVIPWNIWGPENTRCLKNGAITIRRPTNLYGYTFATRTHLLDFNPLAIKRDLSQLQQYWEIMQKEQENRSGIAESLSKDFGNLVETENLASSSQIRDQTKDQVLHEALELFEGLGMLEISSPSQVSPSPPQPRAASHASQMYASLYYGLVTSPTTIRAGHSGFLTDVTTSLPYRSSAYDRIPGETVDVVLCDEDLYFREVRSVQGQYIYR